MVQARTAGTLGAVTSGGTVRSVVVSLALATTLSTRAAVAEEVRKISYWQSSEDSWFVSGTTDAGAIYLRPRLMLGYGSPHWKFVSADAYVTVTNSFASPYLGWRATFPFLDAFLGARTVYPYNRRYLDPAPSHTSDDLDLADRGGERSTYDVVEHEVAGLAPVLHGFVYAQVHPLYVHAPRATQVFEERIRAIVTPPFAMNTRLAYLYGFGEEREPKVGMLLEYVVLPNRPRNILRAGPVAIAQLTDTIEGAAAFSVVVDSPDSLGLEHGAYAFVGIVHRWAKRF